VAAVLALAAPSAGAAASASAVVDLGAKRQLIQGFGTSERAWTDPHLANAPVVTVPASAQDEIMTALYRQLGLTMVRDVIDPGVQTAPGAPFDWARKADAQAAYVKQAEQYGLTTFFPGPVYLEGWMQPNDPGPYVDWAMSLLERWRSLGVTPPYYEVLNEPQVAKNFPPQWLHDVVLQLGRRMRAAGFATKLVIPDDVDPVDAYRRAVAVLQDPQARQYVGAVGFHIYRNGGPADWVRLRQLASTYRLPLWMTEYWSSSYASYAGALGWAETMHQLLTVGSVNAIDYIWGFFGDWAGGSAGALVSLHFANGTLVSWSRTPLFSLMGQYSKFVRPGYRRVTATSDDAAVLVSAYTGPRRAVVVAINTAPDPRPLRLRFVRGKVGKTLAVVQTTASAGLQGRPAVRIPGGRATTTLPPQSVTTFLARR
jgi:glucuronoarabinoxylan endo-1,4-beta-xylanase